MKMFVIDTSLYFNQLSRIKCRDNSYLCIWICRDYIDFDSWRFTHLV